MRRTAVAVIGFGCAMGVFATAGTIPARASASGPNEASSNVPGAGAPANATEGMPADHTRGAPSSGAETATSSKLKTVEYDGYSIRVPSSWQVFHLDTDPGRCVRYDINAVYLGNPGASQNCPSNLIGRSQTITITAAGVSGTPTAQYQGAAVAHGGLGVSLPASFAGRRVASVPATLSTLDQYSQQHEFQAAVAHSDVSLMGTYGGDSGQVESIIRSMRKLPARPSRDGSPPSRDGSPAAGAGSTMGGGSPLASAGKAGKAMAADTTARTLPIKAGGWLKPAVTPTATSEPTATPTPTVTATPAPTWTAFPSITLAASQHAHVPSSPLDGFDTCTAPSVKAMRAWKHKYSAIGIYIGGENMACDYGNLSASWVNSVHSTGWSLLPLYVGLQAPCNSFPSSINPRHAASQGRSAADTAVGDARNLGLRGGSPIYFDMEAYNNSRARCRTTVLAFLDAWTRELHARGYTSGVYSSAASGVTDLVSTTTISGHALAKPDAMWFALWDKENNLTGTPYLPANRWAANRDKQYAGNVTRRVRGYTLTIDADRIGGAVSGP